MVPSCGKTRHETEGVQEPARPPCLALPVSPTMAAPQLTCFSLLSVFLSLSFFPSLPPLLPPFIYLLIYFPSLSLFLSEIVLYSCIIISLLSLFFMAVQHFLGGMNQSLFDSGP